ncbi:IS110 family transposase [Thermovibrio sp.]
MKILGCDVSKNFLVFYDGTQYVVYVDNVKAFKNTKKLPNNALLITDLRKLIKEGDIVILEQTGSYGVRYAKKMGSLGAKVLIADGKAFKRFRGQKATAKNDFIDAKYLRKMALYEPEEDDEEDWRKYIYEFHYDRYRLRTLVRHKIRSEKDLTRFTNRLRQLLADIFHEKAYYDYNRKKLLNRLEEVEKELLQTPDALTVAALTEIEKIKATLKATELVEKEIESIVLNHPDYGILKTFPLGLMSIASLIAYYWDIDLFHSKDSFISYVLMGTKREQSGTSVNSNRTDKTRTEVKAFLYMIYLQTFRKNSLLYPLAQWVKRNYTGGHQNKKRFIKFAHKLLELVYYALKYRLTFPEVIELTLNNMQKQFSALEKISYDEGRIANYRYPELFWVRFSRLRALIPVYQDIASRAWKRAEIITGKEPGRGEEVNGANKERNCQKDKGISETERCRTPSSHSRKMHRGFYGSSEGGSVRAGTENNDFKLRDIPPG